MRVLSIANQKGGVGKTTTAVQAACALALAGKRVLLVDLDPQGNATTSLGIPKEEGTEEVLRDPERIGTIRVQTAVPGLSLLRGSYRLRDVEMEMIRGRHDLGHLRAALGLVRDRHDVVLIDCPPALNLLTLGALVASSGVWIPVLPEFLSLEGLAQMKEAIERVRGSGNPDLALFGILFTMVDPVSEAIEEIRGEIDRHFRNALFLQWIRRDPALAECPSHGQSIFDYRPRSVGAFGYLRTAQEAQRRMIALAEV